MEVREPSARYLVQPAFKQTEVGVIPEDWGVSTIGEEFTIQLGKMLDAEKNVGLPKPFLGNRAVQWGRIDVTDVGEIKLAPSELQRFRLRDGDLLVCEGGEVGRCAIWRQPMDECYYQKALHRLRPRRGFNISLMLNLLHLYSMSGVLQNYVTQTSIAHLPKDKFETIPIPVPPTETEQQAIAEALSDADALIESLEQLLAKKRQIKQGAMQELLTGQKRLPGFSGEWQVKLLGDVADIRDGTHQTPKYADSGIPFFSVENVTSGDFTNTKFISETEHAFLTRSFRIEKDDILMTRIGSIGDCKLIDWDVDASFYVSLALLKIKNGYSAAFISQYSNSTFFKKEVELNSLSSAIPKKINLGPISLVKINIPLDVCEQTAIATLLTDLEAELAAFETKLAKARQLKQGMMQELLTGRIRLV